MSLTATNVVINAGYYLGTVALFPWLALLVESRLGVERFASTWLRGIGLVVGVLSIALQLWCIVLLQKKGGGTPSPARPPIRLVTSGPYRLVRNPLNIGEIGLFVAMAAWFGSAALLVYAALAWFAFHIFVTGWEEPRHARLMGADYDQYCARVNRWVPKL